MRALIRNAVDAYYFTQLDNTKYQEANLQILKKRINKIFLETKNETEEKFILGQLGLVEQEIKSTNILMTELMNQMDSIKEICDEDTKSDPNNN